jgi:UDP-N-acetyl-D-mannosaminuronic acid dehydrogenase
MDDEIKKVSVIGLGYIGLPTAAIFASSGISVIGVDNNSKVVETINRGEIHIVEPGLQKHVANAVNNGLLKATTTPEPADAFLIAVPTPFKDDHKPDLTYIESATKAIAPVLEKGNIVILESTSPVGTTEKMAEWLVEARPDLAIPTQSNSTGDIFIAHCPERVLPGNVLYELVHNDRVIGGINEISSLKAKSVYEIFVQGSCITTKARTAEMAKLTENSFRDVNIAFANELSLICDQLEIDTWELISLANRHPRVDILQPGPGVGGHCIAVDPWFIVDSAPELSKIVKTARLVNDSKPDWVVNKVSEAASQFPIPRIACFGIAFKADIDDLRESPALDIVKTLAKNSNYEILVVEPNIKSLPNVLSTLVNVTYTSMEDALKNADIILGLVDHEPFKGINREKLYTKIMIDTRGMWRERRSNTLTRSTHSSPTPQNSSLENVTTTAI